MNIFLLFLLVVYFVLQCIFRHIRFMHCITALRKIFICVCDFLSAELLQWSLWWRCRSHCKGFQSCGSGEPRSYQGKFWYTETPTLYYQCMTNSLELKANYDKIFWSPFRPFVFCNLFIIFDYFFRPTGQNLARFITNHNEVKFVWMNSLLTPLHRKIFKFCIATF